MTMQFLSAHNQVTEWPWSQSNVKYTARAGIPHNKANLNLAAVAVHED